jgi:hypothetical protein
MSALPHPDPLPPAMRAGEGTNIKRLLPRAASAWSPTCPGLISCRPSGAPSATSSNRSVVKVRAARGAKRRGCVPHLPPISGLAIMPHGPLCRTGHLAQWPPSEPNSRSDSDEVASLHLSVPDCAPKSSANLHGWIALKPFENLRRSTRARSSERAAEEDFRIRRRRPGAGDGRR